MNLRSLIVPLALFPVVVSAQTTVYSTNFSTGAANPAQGSYAAGDWAVLSSRTGSQGVTSYATGAFTFGMTGGSSAVIEAQSRFSNSVYTLTGIGDYIQAKFTFTATNNILVDALNNATLNVGLYDASANTNPVTSLANGGLVENDTIPGFETGFAADWQGYTGRFGHAGASTANHEIRTRPVQTAATGDTESQDLVFGNGVTGGYDNPVGTLLDTGIVPPSNFDLTNGSQYTVTFRITQATLTDQTISLDIYSGTDTNATAIQSISRTATGANLITSEFNALAIGYRFSGTSAASSITLNSVTVDYSSVPEPSSAAALAGLAGLGLTLVRRRRRA